MPISYNPLWQLLAKNGMNKSSLHERIKLSPATIAKLSANKPVSMEVLTRICDYFCCKIEDVIYYTNEVEEFMKKVNGDIESWKYTLLASDWPQFEFVLTAQQAAFLERIGPKALNHQLKICEQEAKKKFIKMPVNPTKVLKVAGKKLEIQSSLAVVELLLPWIIQEASKLESDNYNR